LGGTCGDVSAYRRVYRKVSLDRSHINKLIDLLAPILYFDEPVDNRVIVAVGLRWLEPYKSLTGKVKRDLFKSVASGASTRLIASGPAWLTSEQGIKT
jgi:hypothetical protein